MPIGIWVIITIACLMLVAMLFQGSSGRSKRMRMPYKERVLYDFKQLAQKLEVENKANAIVAEFKARVS